MTHLVLLGDSIFDDAAYVDGAPDVVEQVRARLPQGSRATLLAVDGDVTCSIPEQLKRLPADATHMAVSVGGNDALGSSHLLGAPAGSVADALQQLAQAQERFRMSYFKMVQGLAARRLRTAVCTIYDANYPQPQGRLVATGLSLFNDVITRQAFSAGFSLIDLRLICNHPGDYANPIEPSAQGGEKIADALVAWATGKPSPSSVWT